MMRSTGWTPLYRPRAAVMGRPRTVDRPDLAAFLDTRMHQASNVCTGEVVDVPDDGVNVHPGNPGLWIPSAVSSLSLNETSWEWHTKCTLNHKINHLNDPIRAFSPCPTHVATQDI